MARKRTTLTPEEEWKKAQNTLKPRETQADRTVFLLGLAKMSQHCTFTATGEPAAILPHVPHSLDRDRQRQFENKWEQRSIAMHQQQDHGLDLPQKPDENKMRRAPHVVLGY